MFSEQIMKTKETAEKWAAKQMQNKLTPEHSATEQTGGPKCKQKLAAKKGKWSFKQQR